MDGLLWPLVTQAHVVVGGRAGVSACVVPTLTIMMRVQTNMLCHSESEHGHANAHPGDTSCT